MLKGNSRKSKIGLTLTITLGVVFTICQGFEYTEAPFSIADRAYGSTFFIATGFHGLHVLIGSAFLIVSLIRFKMLNASSEHIVGFECAA